MKVVTDNGNRCLHLSNDDASHNVMIEQEIALDPAWKNLIVSVNIRAADFQAGKQQAHDFRLAMTFRDDHGKRIGGWPIVPKLDTNAPWSTRKATLQIPEGAKSVLLQPSIFGAAGNADFDDVTIIPE